MTDGGYTLAEAWNLQLQARLSRVRTALQDAANHLCFLECQDGKHTSRCKRLRVVLRQTDTGVSP